jgi:hypothetical protein
VLHAFLTKWTGVAAVAGTVLLAGSATPAQAQFVRYRAGMNPWTGTYFARAAAYNPFYGTYYRQTAAYNPYSGISYNSARAYNRFYGGSSLYSYGYPGSYGYGYPASYGYGYPSYGYSGYGSYGDPYGSDLSGYANVVDAEGRFLVNVEQSRLAREQVRQAKVDTQRRAFDEYLYERTNAPTWEDDRERLLGEELRRSRNEPPITEVHSGKALNVLLADLQKAPKSAEAGMVLDPEVARHLNFSASAGNGNIGLLKDVGRLTWPVLLTREDYRELRTHLAASAQEAVREAATGGRVDPALIDAMSRDLDQFGEQLQANVAQTPAPQYIDAKRFLGQFDDAVKALQLPEVGGYFNGRYTFPGGTATDLVKFMTERGLRFAPAVSGDQAAYVAAHRALAVLPAAEAELIHR